MLELAICFGETKVHYLHLAVASDEHVGRRHVAMHDVQAFALAVDQLVRVGQAFANSDADEASLFDWKRLAHLTPVLDEPLQIRPVDVLHHDEVGVVAHADVEDLHAVRVREVCAHARLVQEHADELFLLRQVRENPLDRDDLLETLETRALRSVDLGHSPRSDLLEYLVALLRGGHGRGWRLPNNSPVWG